MEAIQHAEQPKQSEQPARFPYTRAQQWLCLGCLALGVYFERLVLSSMESWRVWTALFFPLCLAGVMALQWDRLKGNRQAQALAAAALLLGGLFAFHPNGDFSVLGGYNLLAVPALCMLAAVNCVRLYPVKREGAMAADWISAWTAGAVTGVPRFFGAIVSAVLGLSRGRARNGALGTLIALPVAAAALTLLCRADAGMARLLSGLLPQVNLWDALGRTIIVLAVGMVSYSCLFNLACREKKPLSAPVEGNYPAPLAAVTLVALSVIYVVFLSLQLSYLFAGTLPQQYTYAEYARAGFHELMWVAAINFSLFGVTVRYIKKSGFIRLLSGLLLLFTGILLASAAGRLLMYIGAYGLTINRILPLWLMAFMAAELVLCALRLKKEALPLLSISAWAFILWYLLLNLPDWASLISAYNGL